MNMQNQLTQIQSDLDQINAHPGFEKSLQKWWETHGEYLNQIRYDEKEDHIDKLYENTVDMYLGLDCKRLFNELSLIQKLPDSLEKSEKLDQWADVYIDHVFVDWDYENMVEQSVRVKRQSLDIKRQFLDPNDPDLIQATLDVINGCCIITGLDQSEFSHYNQILIDYLEHVVALKESELGKNHVDILEWVDLLTSHYFGIDHDKYIYYHEKECEVIAKDKGVNHPDTIRCRIRVPLDTPGYYSNDELLSLHQSLIESCQKEYGDNHYEVAMSRQYLASFYSDNGDKDKAMSAYQKSIEILEKNSDLDSDQKWTILSGYGDYLYSQKMYDQALPIHNQILVLSDDVSDPYLKKMTESQLTKIRKKLCDD